MPSLVRGLAVAAGVVLLAGCAPDGDVVEVTATPLALPSPSATPVPSPTDAPSSPAPEPEPSPSASPSPDPTTEPSPERDPEEARAREVIAAYNGRLVDDGTMMTVPNAQLFETGTIYLHDEADAILEDLLVPVAYYLERDDDVRVRITVHTDNRDDPEYSRYFSQERADFTHKWFRDEGVPGPRMEAIGAGSSEPLPDADNGTAAGREANRRTELVLVGVDAITE